MTAATPITRDHIILALGIKMHAAGHALTNRLALRAADIADAIRVHGLEQVLCGRHDNRPVTFSAAYQLVFGERLK